MLLWALVLAGLAVVGCAATYPRPITARDLADLGSGDALIAYLRQPDASPSVCSPRTSGPHLTRLDESVRASLVEGLTEGDIEPGLWRRCVDRALAGASPEDVSQLLYAVADGYRSLMKNADFETSPALQTRLLAMQNLYIERPNGLDGDRGRLGPLFDQLRAALDARRLGPVATRFAHELLSVVDLERGRYGGRAIDLALIDDLHARGDEALLRRFVDRIPATPLRDMARRRLVALRIAASPYPEVRADAARVEERLLQQGINRLSLREQPASSASLDVRKVAMRGVLVRQDVTNRRAKLLGYGEHPEVSVLPEPSLVGALSVDVAGVSRPVTICQPPAVLDPSPCIGADDVKIGSPFAALDGEGALHFLDHFSAREAVGLARGGNSFALRASVGGRPLLSYDWPLWFERPANLVLSGAFSDGPDLKVAVDHTAPSRLSFTVSGDGAEYHAVVEKPDLPAFRIVSRGAAGRDGSRGSDGSDGHSGLDGSSASCPFSDGDDGGRGGDGGDGRRGGDGGNGRDGGDIQVEVDCGTRGCGPEVVASLRTVIVSEGGPGGSGGVGGKGGRGGRGGSGGSGTTCTDPNGSTKSLSGGSSGMSGHDGHDGWRGSDGFRGHAGKVQFSFVRTSLPSASAP